MLKHFPFSAQKRSSPNGSWESLVHAILITHVLPRANVFLQLDRDKSRQ